MLKTFDQSNLNLDPEDSQTFEAGIVYDINSYKYNFDIEQFVSLVLTIPSITSK